MELLDEWQAPEPSPYFDTRLQARLREEMAKPATVGWLQWVRKPALALSLGIAMIVGITFFRGDGNVHRAADRCGERAAGSGHRGRRFAGVG